MTEAVSSDEIVRVLVVDDQRLVREGIASLLSLQSGVQVIATAANGAEAVQQTRDLHPDVVLMDVRMPVMDGVAATRQILAEVPDCRVVMLTTFDDEEYIRATLEAGAIGYILKDIPSHDLAQAVRMAHKGIYQLDSAAMRQLTRLHLPQEQNSTVQSQQASHPHDALTERERTVLRLIGRGATNREIARTLFISEGTVKNHVSNILARLGLRDRTQAAVYAVGQGLLADTNK